MKSPSWNSSKYFDEDAISLPGFEIESKLGQGTSSCVFLAKRGQDLFAIKCLKASVSASDATASFRFLKEAITLARIQHPGLVKIHEVGEIEARAYIILEYIQGSSLADRLKKGAIPESDLLVLAKQIADTLIEVHNHGVIHHDIKPQNIYISNEGKPKIIDFGLATTRSNVKEEKEILGTLLYSSPEQLGIVDCPIDERSDLYSFGVVLYECLTGTVPFLTTSIGELLHQHAVQIPARVDQTHPSVSRGISEIIAKLLSKDPDDRYQSAHGLKYDLENINKINTEKKLAGSTSLGAADGQFPLGEETPLIGRSQELHRIEEKWQKTCLGKGSLVLLFGEPGAGKSRLARELASQVVRRGASILSGKATLDRTIPFGPFREALNEYLCRVKRLHSSERIQIESRIKDAAGSSAGILSQFTPSLKEILTRSLTQDPKQAYLAAPFHQVIASFFLNLATEQTPLLFLLDDLQWLDPESIQVLQHLNRQLSSSYFMIVATGRDDTSSSPQIELQMKALVPDSVLRISLSKLTLDETRQLISMHMGNSEIDSELLRQLDTRSQGNPFVVEQYLNAMLDLGMLRPNWGKWLLSDREIQSIELPKDVIQVIIQRVEDLSEKSMLVLQAASVLGSTFQLKYLKSICKMELHSLQIVLTEATRKNLIEHLDTNTFSFVHDRIREALLAQASTDTLKHLKAKTAEALEEFQHEDHDLVFTIARLYTQGNSPLPNRVYRLNFAAGKQARKQHAYEQALEFYQTANQGITTVPESETFDYQEGFGDLYLKGKFLNEAIARYEIAEAMAPSRLDQARVLSKIAEAWIAKRTARHAYEYIVKAIPLLGFKIPKINLLLLIKTRLYWWLYTFTPKSLLRVIFPERNRTSSIVLAEVLRVGTAINIYLGRKLDTELFATWSLLLSKRYLRSGVELSDIYSQSLFAFAAINKHRKWIDHYSRTSLDLAKRAGDPYNIAHCMVSSNVISKTLLANLGEGLKYGVYTLEHYGKWLANQFITVNHIVISNSILLGKPQIGEKYLTQLENQFDQKQLYAFSIYKLAVLSALGRIGEASRYLESTDGFILRSDENFKLSYNALTYKALYLLEQGEAGEPLEKLFEAHQLIFESPSCIKGHQFYLYSVYLRFNQWINAAPESKPILERKLLLELKKVSAVSTDFPLLRGHYLVVKASYSQILGGTTHFFADLQKAEEIAFHEDSPWLHYEILRAKARFFRIRSNSASMKHCARLALQVARENLLMNREKWIEREFEMESSTSSEGLGSFNSGLAYLSNTSDKNTRNSKRYLDALLQLSQASCAIINPREQAEIVIRETVRILNAERGFLFLVQGNPEVLEIQIARDFNGNPAESLNSYSKTIVEKCYAYGKAIFFTGSEDGDFKITESIATLNLRSIIATPLRMKDRTIGVLYLDSRIAKGIFTQSDLSILEALGNHIAISQETARAAQLEIEKNALKKDLEAKHAVQNILDNVEHGLLAFDRTGVVQPGVSKSTFEIFKGDPQGKTISELLKLENKKAESFKSFLPLFFEEKVPFNSLKQFAPKTYFPTPDVHIELDYRPIRNLENKVEKILLISSDRTHEIELKRKSEEKANFATMVVRILQNKGAFLRFIFETNKMVHRMEEDTLNLPIEKWNLEEFFRIIHTIKGGAGFYGMQRLATLSHEQETLLGAFKSHRDQRENAEEVRNIPTLLKLELSEFCKRQKTVIGFVDESPLKEKSLKIEHLNQMADRLKQELGTQSKIFQEFYCAFILDPIETAFSSFKEVALQMAETQNKEIVFEIKPSAPSIRIRVETYEGLLQSMIHAFRNAVDHGIEPPEDREKTGKSKAGNIRVQFAVLGKTLTIQVEDDGRGIDSQVIGQLAIKRGLLQEQQLNALEPSDIIQLVFTPGFSSRTQITEASGRGVGLDAIQAEAKKLGGRAWIRSWVGKGTQLFVELPNDSEAIALIS